MTNGFWSSGGGGYMSNSIDWNTPDKVVHDLAALFNWDVDVCSAGPNVCERFFSIEQDGLSQEWRGLCYMNPPYGRAIGKWMRKAVESIGGATVVCLIPARTDARWWQESVVHSSLVVFIAGRLRFSGHRWNAPFSSAFVVFGDGLSMAQRKKLCSYGISASIVNRRAL